MQTAKKHSADFLAAALLSLGMLVVVPVAQAAPQPLDRVAAIVDDDAITDSDINHRMTEIRQKMNERGVTPPPDDVLRKQLMERLIIESIQAQQARKVGVRIDDDTLNNTIASIAKENNSTLHDFPSLLAGQGIDYGTFREELRNDLMINRLQQGRVGSRVHVTDADVAEFMRSAEGRDMFAGSYHLAHILIAVPAEADAAAVQAASAKAADLVKQAREGAVFTDLAIRNSDASDALEGGDLGWRNGAQLPTLFSSLVADMKAGDVAGPLRSGSGFHIVKMIELKLGDAHVIEQSKVRHVLIKPSEIRSNDEARALAQQLHDRVIAGEDFAAIAKKYSDDPGSALAGGDLGWTSPGEMTEEFEKTTNATAPGKVSDVFATEFGWHFLQVVERREQDASDEWRRNQARQAVWKRKFDSELESWLRELRNEAYVEIKTP